MKKIAPILLALLLPACAPGCAALPGYSAPSLGAVVARVDVGKAIACAAEPTPEARAKCLGVSLLTDALGLALDEAGRAGKAALLAASGAGADDLSESDRRDLAQAADEALINLGFEIFEAQR